MKKLWLVLGALVALVVTGAIAAPYWSGAQIEEHFRATVEASGQQGGFPTEIQSYERGVTQSTAVTVTRILLPEEEPFELVVDHLMDHGPKLGQAAVARIQSKLRVPAADTQGVLNKALGGESPLTIVTLVQADGSQDIDVAAPAFEIQNPNSASERVVFGGLTGTAKVAPQAAAFTGSLSAPSLSVVSSDGTLDVRSIGADADMTGSDIPSLWFGVAGMTTAAVRFTPATGEDLMPVELDSLRFGSVMTDSGQTVDISGGYEVGKISFAGETMSDVAFKLSMNSLSRNALVEYIEAAQKFQEEALQRESGQLEGQLEGLTESMLASVTKMLTEGGAVAHIDQLGFVFREGRFDGKGAIRYTGSGDMAAFNPFTDLQASATIKGTRNMIRAIVSEVLATQQYGQRLTELPKEERDAVIGATQFQIDALVKQGFVAEAGEDYVVEAALDPNGIIVNGTPIPIPQAMPAQ